jgi:hypothetical protein
MARKVSQETEDERETRLQKRREIMASKVSQETRMKAKISYDYNS